MAIDLKNINTQAFPTGSYVEIVSITSGNERQLKITCTLQKNGNVLCKGDSNLVKDLEQGFRAYFYPNFELVKPQDGVKFLLGLGSYFNTPYLFASEVKKP